MQQALNDEENLSIDWCKKKTDWQFMTNLDE